MNKFGKTIIIISIATNIILITLFVVMLFKVLYLNNKGYFNEAFYDYKVKKELRESKEDRGSYRSSDVSKKKDHRRAKALSRKFADYVFSMPELKNNFKRLSQIHHELTEISREESYDEERMRELFEEFEGIFITNKNIIVEELLVYMRDMNHEDRAYLISHFLRMPSSPKQYPRSK